MHAHSRGVPYSYYTKFPALDSFFDILAIDIIENKEVVTAVEAYDYPIYAILWHPEMTLEMSESLYAIKDETSLEIARTISNFINKEASMNSNRFKNLK